jgi:Uma2 family endonuclease
MFEATLTKSKKIYYPDSDGEPMANNTTQFNCIMRIEGNLEVMFAHDPNVFVAGDLLWYPVEGHPEIRQAPDAMVAIGRPKGDRGSYKQWEEGNIPPQVVFEVVSPGNRPSEWETKLAFYEEHGVEEYYIYNPYIGYWDGYLRRDGKLVPIENMEGWVSPRLGIKFTKGLGSDVGLFYPDGRPFLSFDEVVQMAETEYRRAEEEKKRAEEEKKRAEEEKKRAEAERQRAEQLAQRLRELGVEVDE